MLFITYGASSFNALTLSQQNETALKFFKESDRQERLCFRILPIHRRRIRDPFQEGGLSGLNRTNSETSRHLVSPVKTIHELLYRFSYCWRLTVFCCFARYYFHIHKQVRFILLPVRIRLRLVPQVLHENVLPRPPAVHAITSSIPEYVRLFLWDAR